MPPINDLARLLRERTVIDKQIAQLLDRPVERGHAGEYIASAIFDINLGKAANTGGTDGYFKAGTLAGKTVNVKWQGNYRRYLCINLKNTGSLKSQPVKYNSLTGLIGRGEQTIMGIHARVLMNSELKVLGRIEIDQKSINQASYSPAYGAEVYNSQFQQKAGLNPNGVESGHPEVYSNDSPRSSTGCCPTTPRPFTSSTWPAPSVMIQWRLINWTVASLSLAMRTV